MVDDEHIYATLDFSSRPSPKTPPKDERKSNNGKKEKKVRRFRYKTRKQRIYEIHIVVITALATSSVENVLESLKH